MAVLYRAHYVTRSVEEAFAKRELPMQVYSGAKFFDRREVKDALAYLRMVAYHDDLSFRRVANAPKRNLGEKRMRFIEEEAARLNCTLYDALHVANVVASPECTVLWKYLRFHKLHQVKTYVLVHFDYFSGRFLVPCLQM